VSNPRSRANAAALLKLLGQQAPPPEAAQPIAVAAAGAGGSGEAGLAAWSKSITLDGTALTVGSVYYNASGTWTSLTPAHGSRASIAVCVAASAEEPVSSTLLLGGELARSGTAGAPLFASDTGTVTETYPGDVTDETTAAPWVWPIGWQSTADVAIILPCDPYRPRLLTLCLADGVTQLAVTLREFPADPA
jgi:hypothetical protein